MVSNVHLIIGIMKTTPLYNNTSSPMKVWSPLGVTPTL